MSANRLTQISAQCRGRQVGGEAPLAANDPNGLHPMCAAMYYRDHAPPHFHAVYGDHEVTIAIDTGEVNGSFPKRALAHVLEWRTLHRDELMETWTLARASKPLPRIEPLE